jgi:hypothetical protein
MKTNRDKSVGSNDFSELLEKFKEMNTRLQDEILLNTGKEDEIQNLRRLLSESDESQKLEYLLNQI